MSITSHFERERAKRLCAAIMSSRLGTSFRTEYHRIGKEEIGVLWYQFADEIDRAVTDKLGELLKPEKRVIQ